MKEILITGGMGYVGSELALLLSRRTDIEVTILDNMMVKGTKIPKNIHMMYGDIRDFKFMSYFVPRFDIVVHLAAIVGEPACVIHPQLAYEINCDGTGILVNNTRKDQHFIFASSSSVYGKRPGEIVTEESICSPINNYSQHKYNCETMIQMNLNWYTIVRPVTAFGTSPATRLDVLVNTLIYEALTTRKIVLYEPQLIRPIIHVHDYARILEMAIDNKLSRNEIYNVGNPYLTMTKEELVKTIAYLCNASVEYTESTSLDKRDYDVSFDKLMNQLDGLFEGYNLRKAKDELLQALPELRKYPKRYDRPHNFRTYLAERNIHV